MAPDPPRRRVLRDGVHQVSLRRIAAELEVTALYSHVNEAGSTHRPGTTRPAS
jgi:hypothetical protein